MAKKKRRMPKHIVLPSGMWRFVKSGSKRKSSPTRRSSKMARRRSRRSYARSARRSKGGFGGGKLMRGMFPVHGMIAGALIGAGIATLQEKFLPQVIPYQGPIAGFAVGGIAGAGGALLRDMFKGGIASSATSIY